MFAMNDGMQQMMEQTQTLAKLWMDTASRMTGAAFAFTPGATPPEAMRQVRDAFLSSWGHSLEAYMRSEPFLRSMRQSLDLAMEYRKQFSQLMTQVHHSTGMAAEEDIRSVMLGLRHVEVRLLRKMEQVMNRLEEIEVRLGEMQDGLEQVRDDVEFVESELGESAADAEQEEPPRGGAARRSRPANPRKRNMPPRKGRMKP